MKWFRFKFPHKKTKEVEPLEKEEVAILLSKEKYDELKDRLNELDGDGLKNVFQNAGVYEKPKQKPYLKTNTFLLYARRVIWLLLLMISSIFSGFLLESFESAFLVLPALVAFIPMIMNTGGNCGAQSSTLMIRGMALNEIAPSKTGRVLGKETLISILLGVSLAGVNFLRVYIQYKNMLLGLAVGIALVITIIISNILGVLVPVALKKMKLDPALMSVPIITTVIDISSIAVYFTFAKMILGI
jgi:magnesium transporter